MVDTAFEKIDDTYSTPTCKVSRRKAMDFADSGRVDHNGTLTVFGQIITELEKEDSDMSNFRKKGTDKKCFSVKFLGEGGEDAGGLFRDCLVNIAQELESPALPLLIKSPNNKNDHGNFRECFILNS